MAAMKRVDTFYFTGEEGTYPAWARQMESLLATQGFEGDLAKPVGEEGGLSAG